MGVLMCAKRLQAWTTHGSRVASVANMALESARSLAHFYQGMLSCWPLVKPRHRIHLAASTSRLPQCGLIADEMLTDSYHPLLLMIMAAHDQCHLRLTADMTYHMLFT